MIKKEDLNQYRDICAEIEEIKKEALLPVADTVRGSSEEYPYTAHTVKIQGVAQNERTKNRITYLLEKKEEIERVIDRMPNSRARRIASMRIKKGMSWDAIAAKMGEGRSPDSERKAYSKALEIVLK